MEPTPAGRVPPPDGRWQRGAAVEALHLASDEATVWAEWYRHLAEAGIPPNQQMPRDLWTWAVDPGLEVADLTFEAPGDRGRAVPHRLSGTRRRASSASPPS